VGGADDFELIAADLSVDALELLKGRIEGVAVVAASASALPFRPESFDLVVSQFGVEYAGLAAFEDAFRLLKPGGRIVTLSHVRGGFIDGKNAALQDGMNKIGDTGFIALAIDLTRAAFSGVDVEETVRRFQPAERELAAFVAEHPGGLHGHLYGGFRQLFERRARYDEGDILGWLDGMAAELDLNRLRLHEMRKAALGDAEIEALRSAASRSGISLDINRMTLAGHSAPVAWRIEGQKR
jgi:SAM-dependent methyltransferase